MKNVRVIFSDEAEAAYKYLNSSKTKPETTILKAVHKKIEIIKSNIHYGEPISKHLIPNEYVKKYSISNLFRVELPNFWRMLYTLTDGESEIEIIAFVLDVVDHKKYDNKFGYKS